MKLDRFMLISHRELLVRKFNRCRDVSDRKLLKSWLLRVQRLLSLK